MPASIYYHPWSENCTGGGWNTSGYPAACTGSHRNFVRKSPTDFGCAPLRPALATGRAAGALNG